MKKLFYFFSMFLGVFLCNRIPALAANHLESGLYYIQPKHAEDKVIDVYNNGKGNSEYIILYDKNNPQTENQQFFVADIGHGYYAIVATHSGKVLDVKGGNRTELANIIQYDYHGGDNQIWIIEDVGNGYYTIHAKYDYNMCWDIYEASNINGTPLAIYPYNGNDNQKFKFTKIDKTIYGPQKEHKSYRTITKRTLNYKVSLACRHSQTRLKMCLVNDTSADLYWVVARECTKCGGISSYTSLALPN
ncbi:hypothetical protein IMSAGC020_01982 [Lachnospiraceae bacterium]|nr:hypothetical protein IMSAGC020_01982 [Lachnospiraceae bacterium]